MLKYIDKKLLKDIAKKRSPSGYERELKEFVYKYINDKCKNVKAIYDKSELYAYRLSTDKNAKTILFDAHIDEVSCRVFNISDEGFLLCKPFGMNNHDIIGSRCTIMTSNGNIPGIISILPPHLSLENTDIIIDIFTNSKSESEKIVEIGDSVVFEKKIQIIKTPERKQFITGPGLDNHIGVFILTKLFLEIDKMDQINYNFIAHFSSKEEVSGLAYINMLQSYDNIPKNIDMVFVIDTDIANDIPNIDKTQFSISKLGKGTIITRNFVDNNDIFVFLKQVANENKINYQITMSDGNGGNNLMFYSKLNVIGQSIGIPLRYMHSSVEVVCFDDINTTILLLLSAINNLNRFFTTTK
jgi:putative aminopeptidase FrvX